MNPVLLVLSAPGRNRLEHWRHLRHVCDRSSLACCCVGTLQGWESRYADFVINVPPGSPAAVAASMLDGLPPGEEVCGVVCVSEVYVPIQASLCERLGLPGPTVEMSRIGRNKMAMREFVASCGIPQPRFTLYEGGELRLPSDLSFPVVAKPVIGSSATLVRAYSSRAALQDGLPQLQQAATLTFADDVLSQEVTSARGLAMMVEEQVLGEICFETTLPYSSGEISIESIAVNGSVDVVAVHDAPVPTDGPFFEKVVNSTPTRLPLHLVGQAVATAGTLHTTLGRGAYVLHTEMKTRYDGLKLLEFGIRIGGSSLYRSVKLSTGVDLLDFVLDIATGRQPPPVVACQIATPTVIQYLAPTRGGRIRSIRGIASLEELPSLAEFRFYDDVGSSVRSPPFKAHASGYAAFRGTEFDVLERDAAAARAMVRFDLG
jgi:biotin carboxylase